MDGRFKLTEQGEVIFARYGEPIAMRHIDQDAAATLLASSPEVKRRTSAAAARFADVAATMDAASRERFFSLVHAKGFAPWFATVTPLEEIGLLALGCRPARRGLSVESLEDLRAILWVFAWTQARINLAGWFGLLSRLASSGGGTSSPADAARTPATSESIPRSPKARFQEAIVSTDVNRSLASRRRIARGRAPSPPAVAPWPARAAPRTPPAPRKSGGGSTAFRSPGLAFGGKSAHPSNQGKGVNHD